MGSQRSLWAQGNASTRRSTSGGSGRALRGTRRLLVALIAVLGLMAVSAGAASPAGKDKWRKWVVKPGHSIQKVADKAKSGDIILLERGVYHDAVCVHRKGLTFVGAGQGETVVRPPKEKFRRTLCWKTPKERSAFAFVHPDRKVEVGHLTTRDHHGNGVFAFGARHGVKVFHHTGLNHGEYGVAAFWSKEVVFTHNIELGHGEAGLYVGDTDNAKAYVAHNVTKGWTFGILLRDSRHGLVKDNLARGNCVGALVLDTGPNRRRSEPKAAWFTNHPAGAWALVHNEVVDNDRFCRAKRPEVPALSGNGVVVVGADHVLVKANKIVNNNATKRGFIPSSGVAVLSGKYIHSDDPEHVSVVYNKVKHNDLDILWDEKGKKIKFHHNDCWSSKPHWICKG